MDIKASDCSWAKVHFSDTSEARAALLELEQHIKQLKTDITKGCFRDPHDEAEMKREVVRLEKLEDELCDVLFQDLFDLL